MRATCFLGGSAVALALLGGGVAHAQTADDDEAVVIDEVFVEAQRRIESAQDVPIALTAIDGAAIERLNARDIRDISSLVPNLQLDSVSIGPSLSNVSIRGIASQDPEKSFDPAVGTFVDGIYLGSSAFNLIDTFDLERIEVLRGPQGTLFGRNTTGGAINAVRTRPTFQDEFRGSILVGSDERFDLKGVANFDLSPATQPDVVGLKVGGYYQTDDGVYRNLAGGPNGAVDRWGATAGVLLQPTDNFDAYIVYDHARDNSELQPYHPVNIAGAVPLPITITGTPPVPATVIAAHGPDAACTKSFLIPPATFQPGVCTQEFSTATDPHSMDAQLNAITFNSSWRFSDTMELVTILGYRDSSESVRVDFDGTERDLFSVLRVQDYNQFSAEARFVSSLDGPLNFVAGAFYFDSDYQLNQAIKIDLALVAPVPFLGLAFLGGAGDQDNVGSRSMALYAQADYEVTDQLTLTLGGRLSRDEKSISTILFDPPAGLIPGTPAAAAFRVADGIPANQIVSDQGSAEADFSDFSPRVALDYQVNSDLLLYASWTQGYNSGGFSARAGTVATVTEAFQPEDVTAWEAGFKSDLLGGRARLNGAVFFTDYKNKQEEIIEPAPPPIFTSTTVRNAADAEIWGAELEGTFLLNNNFRIDGSVGYLNAQYTEFDTFIDSATYVSFPAQPFGTLLAADFSDLRLRQAPKWTASLQPTFTTDTAAGEFSLGATARYTDTRETQFENDVRGRR
ncbi:MAG: TonB-dependent receptor, partial [Pseudomonadota bacterium]